MPRSSVAGLALAAVLAAGCGASSAADDVVHTYRDGDVGHVRRGSSIPRVGPC